MIAILADRPADGPGRHRRGRREALRSDDARSSGRRRCVGARGRLGIDRRGGHWASGFRSTVDHVPGAPFSKAGWYRRMASRRRSRPSSRPSPSLQANGLRAALSVPLLREGVAIGAITIRRVERRPFRTSRSSCSRRSRTRRSSPSRTRASSRSWSSATRSFRRATARSPKRWSSRPRRPTCCASSPAHPPSSRTSSTHWSSTAARLCGAEHAVVQVPDGDMLRIVASVLTNEEAARTGPSVRQRSTQKDFRRHRSRSYVRGSRAELPWSVGRFTWQTWPTRRSSSSPRAARSSRRIGVQSAGDSATDPGRRADRRVHAALTPIGRLQPVPGGAARNVRGPGRHRDRERPPVRGAGAAQRRASG